MVKPTLIFLQIALAASAVLALYVNDSKLIYLASFKSGIAQHSTEKEYYISPSSATWSNANLHCTRNVRPSGTLLAIESLAEWQFLSELLENLGFGTTYWTSGKFDPERLLWIWSANDEPLPPFAPVFPNDPNQLLRVIVYVTNDMSMRIAPHTQLHRFICELRTLM